MADKRISQLAERTDIANNDVVAIVASGATVTNKATISSIQSYMQTALDVGVTSVGVTLGSSGTDVSVTGSPITTSGNITINIPSASATARGLVTTEAQTFAGIKTFNSTIVAGQEVQLVSAGTASTTFVKNISGSALTSVGSNGFGFNNADHIYFSGSNKGGGVLAFNNTGNPIYTLQDASGTLAFTSDITNSLTGFVTLDTAQTITGEKTFTNNIILKNSALAGLIVSSFSPNALEIGATLAGITYYSSIVFPAGDQSWNLPNASGTIALTSDLGAYLPLTLTSTQRIVELNGQFFEVYSSANTFTSGRLIVAPTYGAIGYQTNGIFRGLQILTDGTAVLTNTGTLTMTGPLNGTSASFTTSGGDDTLIVNHTSGSGIALDIAKAGNGEGLRVAKTSGSGNAMSVIGGNSNFDGGITTTSAVLTSVLQGVNANFTGLIETDANIRVGTTASIKHNSAVFTLNGFNNIQGDINSFVVTNETKNLRLNFPSVSGLTHTLPDASGTLALTTDLGAYLPLTGGTLTGALNGTSASFSSSVTAGAAGINGVGAIYPLYVRTGTNQRARFVDNGGLFQFGVLNDAESAYSDLSLGNSAVVIKSTGNVGIGTASPINQLDLNNISTTFWDVGFNAVLNGGDSELRYISAGQSGGRTGSHVFYTGTAIGGTERMRITSEGKLLVGQTVATGTFDHVFRNTTNLGTAVITQTSSVSNPSLGLFSTLNSGDNLWVRFFYDSNGFIAGSIDYNRAAGLVRYNTTSDANLKNLIGDSDKQKSVDLLNLTKIREYSWKNDESNKLQIGVIAQELFETYKGAVSVGSDEELLGTEDYKPWGVDKTAFTFHLIAGFQEHERIIKELQTEIDSLKNQMQ